MGTGVNISKYTHTSAHFSSDRLYRYMLVRQWEEYNASYLNCIMLNPSTADETVNDPTVERCERRARSMGFGGLVVTNLFALRSTDPAALRLATDPVGPENDRWLRYCASRADMILCGWGNHGQLECRSTAVRRILFGTNFHILGLNKTGEPKHPLYVGYEVQPQLWVPKG